MLACYMEMLAEKRCRTSPAPAIAPASGRGMRRGLKAPRPQRKNLEKCWLRLRPAPVLRGLLQEGLGNLSCARRKRGVICHKLHWWNFLNGCVAVQDKLRICCHMCSQ